VADPNPASPVSAAPAARSFWRRRFRDPVIAQLKRGITPDQIAITLAVGCCCAMFPVLGTTTLLCFLAALVLRLNQPIIHLVNQALWPAQISGIFGCVRLGEWVTGATPASFNLTRMHEVFWSKPSAFFQEFGATVGHAVIGWSLLAPFCLLAVFYLTRPILRAMNRLRAEAAAKATADPAHPLT
jgi:uncharacterized protein (DUF2062 family)